MKAQYKNIKLESKFKGNKLWKCSNLHNMNNHKITVINLETKKRLTFDYWCSIASPRIEKEIDLFESFNCFLSDSMSGNQSFELFCDELGYEPYEKESKKIYNACVKSLEKFERVFPEYDIYDLCNDIREYLETLN